MEKETFILRTEWYESIQELDEKSKAELLDNLFLFHLNEETKINLNNLMVKLVWKLIEPNLRRNIESYDKRKSTSSENGKKGGRPPKYQQVTENKKNLNNLNKPNESLSVSVSVSDIDNNVLLEKEPKYILGENESFEKNNSQISDELNSEKKEKEKSCAKKEKEIQDLRHSDFFKTMCDYFSQTSEVLQMRAFGDLVRIYNSGKIEEFIIQTNAYMDYKKISLEKVHRFQNYVHEWSNEDWVNKLKNVQKSYGKSTFSTNR